MKTITNYSNILPSFQIAGIDVDFHDRVFWIHTQDDELFDVVCSYLFNEGFFWECGELFGKDWNIKQI